MPRDICEQQDGCSNLIEVFLECTSVEACCCMHGLQKWCKQADALNMAEIGMSGSKHMPQVLAPLQSTRRLGRRYNNRPAAGPDVSRRINAQRI